MTDYWKVIERRLHEESLLHYPNNILRGILESYINGTLNLLDEYDRTFFEQGFLLTATGNFLDEKGAELGIARYAGKIATGAAIFYVDEINEGDGAVSTISIPRGTIISNYITGLEYVTTEAASIGAGETSVTVSIQGISYGAKYNCGENEIIYIESESVSSRVNVYNDISVTGGVDGETDDEYRKRLFNFICTYLNVPFLKKQGITIYSSKKYSDNVRLKMTSLNPHMSNQYCAIPPNDTVMNYLLNDVIYYRVMKIYIKGWK